MDGTTVTDPAWRGRQRLQRMDALLRQLYRRHMWTESISHPSELASELGWSEEDVERASRGLIDRRLAEGKETGGGIALTSHGIALLEEGVLKPAAQAPPAANEIRIGTASGVQIQQGAGGSSQQMGSGSAAATESDDPDAELVQQRQKDRLAILTYLYDATGGDPDQLVRWRDVMAAVGIEDQEDFIGQFAYLRALGLADLFTHDSARILSGGVDRIELAELHPRQRTEGLTSMNVLVIENATDVQIQQGTQDSVQIQSLDEGRLDEVRSWLADYEGRIGDLGLEDAELREALATLATAKAQASRDRPRLTLLRAAVQALYEFAIAAGGSGVGTVAAAYFLNRGTPF